MPTTTLYALPACNSIRIFEVRHLAVIHGCAFGGRVKSKPKPDSEKKQNFVFTSGHVDYLPAHIAARRFFVTNAPTPFDPNDGGRAA